MTALALLSNIAFFYCCCLHFCLKEMLASTCLYIYFYTGAQILDGTQGILYSIYLLCTKGKKCFHCNATFWSELAIVSQPVDCVMVYIYCTNTLSGLLCLSHKANTHLHGDSWEEENENTPDPKEEATWWHTPPSCSDHETSSLKATNKAGYQLNLDTERINHCSTSAQQSNRQHPELVWKFIRGVKRVVHPPYNPPLWSGRC